MLAQVHEHEVVVRAARHDIEAALHERRRERPRVRDDLRGVRRLNDGFSASLSATALAAITCSSGPPCMPGNTALSIAFACSRLAQDEPAARPAQRLVRRRRDDVRVRHRRRIHARRDESGEVRHVHHEDRADLARDFGERARSR